MREARRMCDAVGGQSAVRGPLGVPYPRPRPAPREHRITEPHPALQWARGRGGSSDRGRLPARPERARVRGTQSRYAVREAGRVCDGVPWQSAVRGALGGAPHHGNTASQSHILRCRGPEAGPARATAAEHPCAERARARAPRAVTQCVKRGVCVTRFPVMELIARRRQLRPADHVAVGGRPGVAVDHPWRAECRPGRTPRRKPALCGGAAMAAAGDRATMGPHRQPLRPPIIGSARDQSYARRLAARSTDRRRSRIGSEARRCEAEGIGWSPWLARAVVERTFAWRHNFRRLRTRYETRRRPAPDVHADRLRGDLPPHAALADRLEA